jgi:hypothetical protein
VDPLHESNQLRGLPKSNPRGVDKLVRTLNTLIELISAMLYDNCPIGEWGRQRLPVFLSTQSKSELLAYEDFSGMKLEQKRLKQVLKQKYGSWLQAPVEDQIKVKNLYLDYRNAERALYRKVSNLVIHSISAD